MAELTGLTKSAQAPRGASLWQAGSLPLWHRDGTIDLVMPDVRTPVDGD